ncbi:MAG: nitroreductase family protein [Desulfobacterales bacterium]
MSDIMTTIRERRSIRNYADKEVPEDALHAILEAVQWTRPGPIPSAGKSWWSKTLLSKQRFRKPCLLPIPRLSPLLKPRWCLPCALKRHLRLL